jgi:N-acetylneuraminic acid mutarotase
VSQIISAQSWLQISDFPGLPRDDGSVFTIGNKAYCFSGLSTGGCAGDGYVYDGVMNAWGNMASLPSGRERQYATAFSYSNTGYMLCGIDCNGNCLNDMYKYDVATNTWTNIPNFPGNPRQAPCNFVLGNKAYIISGRLTGTAGVVYNDVWEYNITSATWTQKNNLPFAGMFRGSAFVINGVGYIAYGLTNNNNFNRSIYQYDQANDQWMQIPNVNLPARNYVGCAVTSNTAFFYGGQDSTYQITNDVRLFDPTTGTITVYPGIPALGRKGGMAFSLNNIFYITTGVDSSPARIKETWKNDAFVGIKQHHHSEINLTIYPNPAFKGIYIETTEDLIKAVMSGPLGNVISEHYTKNISVSDLPPGVYSLSIFTESYIINKKIVINHRD